MNSRLFDLVACRWLLGWRIADASCADANPPRSRAGDGLRVLSCSSPPALLRATAHDQALSALLAAAATSSSNSAEYSRVYVLPLTACRYGAHERWSDFKCASLSSCIQVCSSTVRLLMGPLACSDRCGAVAFAKAYRRSALIARQQPRRPPVSADPVSAGHRQLRCDCNCAYGKCCGVGQATWCPRCRRRHVCTCERAICKSPGARTQLKSGAKSRDLVETFVYYSSNCIWLPSVFLFFR